MELPDYHGGSIVNLMASFAEALEGPETGYTPLAGLAAADLSCRHLIFIVVDGVGHGVVAGLKDSALQAHLRRPLTSVFPTTTVSAVTSYYTAAGPQQHGMTGWFTWFRELGSVATVLPFVPRHGGMSFTEIGVDPGRLLLQPSFFDSLPVEAHVFNPDYIAESAYSRACSGRAIRHAYAGIEDLFARLTKRVSRGRNRSFTLAYWPEFDSLAHQRGAGSAEAEELLRRFDRQLTRFLDAIAGQDAVVVVSADHGILDTGPESYVALEGHPELLADLALPLCGEPRAAYCYVHARRRERFEEYVRGHLSHCCALYPSERLLEEGWFGLGRPHPELAHRIGDYLLLMKGRYVVTQRLLGEAEFSQRGVHGGLSPAELYVPLILFRP